MTAEELAELRAAMPWNAESVQDMAWLQENGFKRKCVHDSTWTADDIQRLQDGLCQLADRRRHFHANMDPAYWLSQHVMHRKYSAKACARKVLQLARSLKVEAQVTEEDIAEAEAEEGLEDTEESADKDAQGANVEHDDDEFILMPGAA